MPGANEDWFPYPVDAKIFDARIEPYNPPAQPSQEQRIADLEKLTQTMATAMSTMQQSLIRAHQKLIELEADRITPENQSKLILPDRMN